jgi:hypothetical protein
VVRVNLTGYLDHFCVPTVSFSKNLFDRVNLASVLQRISPSTRTWVIPSQLHLRARFEGATRWPDYTRPFNCVVPLHDFHRLRLTSSLSDSAFHNRRSCKSISQLLRYFSSTLSLSIFQVYVFTMSVQSKTFDAPMRGMERKYVTSSSQPSNFCISLILHLIF